MEQALKVLDGSEERWWEAEVYRIRGEMFLNDERGIMNDERRTGEIEALQHFAGAETCFQQALEIARYQQAKSLELCASTSLARLWQEQGKKAEAHNLLAPVYNWLCVQLRLAYSVGVSPTRVRIRSPVAWMAGGRET